MARSIHGFAVALGSFGQDRRQLIPVSHGEVGSLSFVDQREKKNRNIFPAELVDRLVAAAFALSRAGDAYLPGSAGSWD